MNILRNIDLNLLVIFEAIYSNGKISQAAIQLGVSQPTISNSLSRLRDTLDDQLFIRAQHGVIPTPRANELITPVREALQTIQQSLSGSQSFDPGQSTRQFKLLVAEPMEQVVLPALINGLPAKSGVTFDYFSPLSQVVEESLISGNTELAVFLLPAKTPGLQSEVLCPVDLVGIASTNHPRIKKETKLTLQNISREGHVGLNLQPGKIRNSEKASIHPTPVRRVICRVTSVGAIARIVGSTDLIGMIPRLFSVHACEAYNLNIFELPMEMSSQKMFMLWHNRHDSDLGHLWLREQVRLSVANGLNAITE